MVHNRKILTKEANAYAEHVKRIVTNNLARIQQFPIGNKELVYAFDLTVYFNQLENAGWFRIKSNGEKDAQTRYKEIDVDNRIKFVQDCVIKTLGIPSDAQIFEGAQRKKQSSRERAVVRISVIDRDQFFREDE